MPKQVVTAGFTVGVGGLKLSKAQLASMNKAIQSAALAELARLDLAGDVAVRIPNKGWFGIWLERRGTFGPIPVAPPVGPGR